MNGQGGLKQKAGGGGDEDQDEQGLYFEIFVNLSLCLQNSKIFSITVGFLSAE